MNNSKDFDDILKQLKVIVGSNNYIDDVLKMGPYLSDWRDQFQGVSPLILKPINSQMVSEILTLCNESHIGVDLNKVVFPEPLPPHIPIIINFGFTLFTNLQISNEKYI